MSLIVTPTPNQSFLLKQIEFRVACALGAFMADLGSGNTVVDGAWAGNPYDMVFGSSSWRVANQKFILKGHTGHSYIPHVLFDTARWDPEHSDIDYGEKKLEQAVVEQDGGKTKVIQNLTAGEVHVAYDESVDLTNTFGSSITKGVTLDVTTDKSASVSASTTVSGGYAGVSAEVSLGTELGISESKSKSESSEEAKEQSEEGTKSAGIAIDFTADPRSNYLLEITKENQRTSQPFNINGVMDFDMALHPWHGSGHNSHYRPKSDLLFRGVDALMQAVFGYDTNYPELAGYWKHASESVKSAMDWLQKPENRRIQVSGINHASLDSNANYKLEPLGTSVPTEWAHLPIVDADSVKA